jgi:hypothetical protein
MYGDMMASMAGDVIYGEDVIYVEKVIYPSDVIYAYSVIYAASVIFGDAGSGHSLPFVRGGAFQHPDAFAVIYVIYAAAPR